MAAAFVVSEKMSLQAATLGLVVRVTEPFWSRREMTWNREAASSAGGEGRHAGDTDRHDPAVTRTPNSYPGYRPLWGTPASGVSPFLQCPLGADR